MTLLDFFQNEIPANCQSCYVSVVSKDGQYYIHVEMSSGVSVYCTHEPIVRTGLISSKLIMSELANLLTFRGIQVFRNREEWNTYNCSHG